MIWRDETVGYNAPELFFKTFGKRMMTLDQIRNVAKGWLVWVEVAAGRGVTMDSNLYFQTALDTFEKEASGEPLE